MKNLRVLGKLDKKYSFLGEMAFLFALIHMVNVLFFAEDLGFTHLSIHPYWIVVLLMSTQYGLAAGMGSGILAAILYAVFFYHNLEIKGGMEQFAEQGGLWLPLFFVTAGLVLGNNRQKHILLEEQKDKIIEAKDIELSRFRDFSEANEKARKVLEARIVGETSTIKTLYESARKLDALNFEDVLNGFLEVLSQHFHVQKASVYLKEEDFLFLKAAVGWSEAAKAQAKTALNKSLMRLAFQEGKRVTVKELLQRKDMAQFSADLGQVLAMFPLKDSSGQVIGVVNIEKIDFFYFHHANLEIMDLLVQWLGAALEKVRFCERMSAQAVWDGENDCYHAHYFYQVLADEFTRGKLFGQKFATAMVKIERFGFFEDQAQKYLAKGLISILKRELKSTDKVFSYRLKGVWAVISPAVEKKDLLQALEKAGKEFQEIYEAMPGCKNIQGLTFAVEDFHEGLAESSDMIQPLLKHAKVV